MSIRSRLALAAALAVAVAVAAASALTYYIVRHQLRGQVDTALEHRAHAIARVPAIHVYGSSGMELPDAPFGGAPGYVQAVSGGGTVRRPPDETLPIPADERVEGVARGKHGRFFADTHLAGTHMRVLTFQYGDGWAIQVARPLSEVDASLHRIRNLLILVALCGIAIALALGLAVARAALAPVRRLTAATEHISATRDLTERIDAGEGRDELSRLAGSFNTMLGALEESARSQRQLVSDASHELRTPLTSLRTNIEVLARDRKIPAGDRERLLTDVTEQLSELTALVAELVELARGDVRPLNAEDVRLDLVVADAVERARRNFNRVRFHADLSESTVHGVPNSIERAVANLLDNAGKWSPPDGVVDVTVRDGEVVVRDHGPGIDEADLPHVFDRFYRAPAARGRPGSGLGLAIVRQVAEAHGGAVVAERAEGGGTLVRLDFLDAS